MRDLGQRQSLQQLQVMLVAMQARRRACGKKKNLLYREKFLVPVWPTCRLGFQNKASRKVFLIRPQKLFRGFPDCVFPATGQQGRRTTAAVPRHVCAAPSSATRLLLLSRSSVIADRRMRALHRWRAPADSLPHLCSLLHWSKRAFTAISAVVFLSVCDVALHTEENPWTAG
jgi:hypothetical protein